MSMGFAIKQKDGDVVVSLHSILDMAAAEGLLTCLRESVSKNKNVILDASNIERVSTPCMQIILATAKKVETNGHIFGLLNPSVALERGMRELGMMDYLNNWRSN